MTIRTLPAFLSFALACGTVAAGERASCSRASAAHSPRLIELYTSEGCSSCPPADRWLATLDASAGVVPIALHVDYWDDIGWVDRFGDPRFGRRQSQLVARAGGRTVYTPQVFVDGREWRDWYRGGTAPRAGADAPPALRVTADADVADRRRWHVIATLDRAAADWQVHVLATEDAVQTEVRAGENRGKTLQHRHVVRAWAGPAASGQAAQIALPADVDPQQAALVVFAERRDTGAIGPVVRLALDACAGAAETRGP